MYTPRTAYPTFSENGNYTITKPSGWIVTRTDDYPAAVEFAKLFGYEVSLSR